MPAPKEKRQSTGALQTLSRKSLLPSAWTVHRDLDTPKANAQRAGVNSSLSKYSGYAYAVMRIIVGLLFATHGAQKLFGMFGGKGGAEGMMLVAGIIELAGGILIALGLFTRPAAFLSSGVMAFAYFMAHAGQGYHPVMNKGELAVVYCFLFLYMFFRGAGPLSVDSMIGGRAGTAPDEVGGPMRTGREL